MLTWKHTNDLGFREKYTGTMYLREVVNYILEKSPEERPRLVTEVYPAVGEKYGRSGSAVERAIRHTIDRSEFHGTNADVIYELVQRCRDDEFDD